MGSGIKVSEKKVWLFLSKNEGKGGFEAFLFTPSGCRKGKMFAESNSIPNYPNLYGMLISNICPTTLTSKLSINH